MKIAVLTNDLGGGTGNHLLSMLKHWDKTLWQTVIFSSAPVRDRVVPDVPVVYIPPSKTFGFYPIAQILYLARLQKVMKERRPDIVHAFFFWSIIYGRLLKLAGTVKTLVENREDQGFDWGRHEYLWLRSTNRSAGQDHLRFGSGETGGHGPGRRRGIPDHGRKQRNRP